MNMCWVFSLFEFNIFISCQTVLQLTDLAKIILQEAVFLKGTYHWKRLELLGLGHPRDQLEVHQNHLALSLVQSPVQLKSLGWEGRKDSVKKLQNLTVKEEQQMLH